MGIGQVLDFVITSRFRDDLSLTQKTQHIYCIFVPQILPITHHTPFLHCTWNRSISHTVLCHITFSTFIYILREYPDCTQACSCISCTMLFSDKQSITFAAHTGIIINCALTAEKKASVNCHANHQYRTLHIFIPTWRPSSVYTILAACSAADPEQRVSKKTCTPRHIKTKISPRRTADSVIHICLQQDVWSAIIVQQTQ